MNFVFERQKQLYQYSTPYKEKYLFLFEDGSEVIAEAGLGPGHWYRLIKDLQNKGYNVRPEDFDGQIPFLYYYYRPEELRGKSNLLKKYNFFVCPKCDCIYPKASFKSHNPCDNCLNGW